MSLYKIYRINSGTSSDIGKKVEIYPKADYTSILNEDCVNIITNLIASGGYIRTGQKSGTDIGAYATAEGYNTTASGTASHAEGYYTTASGIYSHAEGYYTTASGDYSHAENNHTTASDVASHAEGYYTTASGMYSHAEGYKTTASDVYSHAEGYYTTASGMYSHAEGRNTTASGTASHAEGLNIKAIPPYSHFGGCVSYDDSTTNQIFDTSFYTHKTNINNGTLLFGEICNYSESRSSGLIMGVYTNGVFELGNPGGLDPTNAINISETNNAFFKVFDKKYRNGTLLDATNGSELLIGNVDSCGTTVEGQILNSPKDNLLHIHDTTHGNADVDFTMGAYVESSFNEFTTISGTESHVVYGAKLPNAPIYTPAGTQTDYLFYYDTDMLLRMTKFIFNCTPTEMPRAVFHTNNLNDYGEVIDTSGYSDSANSTAVLTIPNASWIYVIVRVQSESTSWDWGCVWEGSNSSLTASNNYSTSISGKLGGSKVQTFIYPIYGNSATVSWKSDTSVHNYYGFYALAISADTREPRMAIDPVLLTRGLHTGKMYRLYGASVPVGPNYIACY